MRYIFYILLFLAPAFLFGQGFDWQYSARMPSHSPTSFIGVGFGGALNTNSADFTLSEDMDYCGKFESGDGYAINYRLVYEDWLSPYWAWSCDIGYSVYHSRFTQPESVDRGLYILETEYRLDSDIDYLILSPGIKYRLFNSHLHVGAGFIMSFLLSNSNTLKEVVVSPRDRFDFPNGTDERELGSGRISDYRKIYFAPWVKAGMDFSLGLGIYAEPSVSIVLPVLDILDSDDWKRYGFVFGLRFYYGII